MPSVLIPPFHIPALRPGKLDEVVAVRPPEGEDWRLRDHCSFPSHRSGVIVRYRIRDGRAYPHDVICLDCAPERPHSHPVSPDFLVLSQEEEECSLYKPRFVMWQGTGYVVLESYVAG